MNVQSIASTLFRRGNTKLYVALGIPLGIIWLFIYAQQQAVVEEKKFQDEQKEHATAATISVQNYSLKEVDDNNQVRWQLVAKEGIQLPSGKAVKLKDVIVEYFDGPKLKMRLSSPRGEAEQTTHYVKLEGADGKRVCAEGEDGKAKLESETLELIKKNQFDAKGGVTIEWPNVAKVTGDTATGAIGTGNLENCKLAGNTHAILGIH